MLHFDNKFHLLLVALAAVSHNAATFVGADFSQNSLPGAVNSATDVRTYIENECLNSLKESRRLIAKQDLFKCVKKLPETERQTFLVTGGAGFVGSHLVDSLMLRGYRVIVCDNFHTGRRTNIEHWLGHADFQLIEHDVIEPLDVEVDHIYHLASPASPIHYMADPVRTIMTNTLGTMNMLRLATKNNATVVLASTSEVYGDPEIHPQPETYWGNVNPIGPRSCYDESKRLSESLMVAHKSRHGTSIRIARIFNTYGPRMHPQDGRVISNFIMQALKGAPITVYGLGNQTRSFQYITDLVSGLEKLMHSNIQSPVNFGNPNEMTIRSLAQRIRATLPDSNSILAFGKLPVDDPHRRRPNISKAIEALDWRPLVSFDDGLNRTIEYFRQEL